MTTSSNWRAVRRRTIELRDSMDELAPIMTVRIRDEESAYAVVPFDEHVQHVAEQQVRLLAAIAERRTPDDDDLVRAVLLGRRRATQGVPVEAVIGAYHVGNRELWDRLRSEPAPVSALPDVAALMWRSVQLITATLAAAHNEVMRALQADQVTLRHRLVSLLQADAIEDEAVQIARTLGFDPAGSFVAVCSPIMDFDSDGFGGLRAALERLPAAAIDARSANTVVVIAQVRAQLEPTARDLTRLLTALRRERGAAPLAVGLPRTHLAGAARSLRDAQRVLATTRSDVAERATFHFADHWLRATVLVEADQLRDLVAAKLPVVEANPRLVEAVAAFADHDLSASASAQALGVHPNTALYRLGRWEDLTGWSPRTFRGLALSLLASWLAEETQAQKSQAD